MGLVNRNKKKVVSLAESLFFSSCLSSSILECRVARASGSCRIGHRLTEFGRPVYSVCRIKKQRKNGFSEIEI